MVQIRLIVQDPRPSASEIRLAEHHHRAGPSEELHGLEHAGPLIRKPAYVLPRAHAKRPPPVTGLAIEAHAVAVDSPDSFAVVVTAAVRIPAPEALPIVIANNTRYAPELKALVGIAVDVVSLDSHTVAAGTVGNVKSLAEAAGDQGIAPDEVTRRGAEHYDRGETLYQQGDYEGAVRELVYSYCLVPAFYTILEDIGQIYERNLDYEKAIGYLERYVRAVPPPGSPRWWRSTWP